MFNEKLTAPARLRLNCYRVIFGCPEQTHVVNAIVLLAKQFIVNQHYGEGIINVPAFRQTLWKYFSMEKVIAYNNVKIDKFRERWRPFITEECEFNL